MRMYEAAEAVLKDKGSPMEAKEIYNKIIENNLFQFGAKDPVAVLKQTLRKRSEGTKQPMFKKTGTNTYNLI